MRQQGINGLRGVHAGSCHAWPLPADATCATVARQVFRDAVSGVGLEPDLLDDCVLMASELAANTLHARAVAGTGGGGDRLVSVAPDMGGEPISAAGPVPKTSQSAAPAKVVPGCPELWIYFRGRLVRADQPGSDMSVLSVCRGLTVWCRSGFVSLTTSEGGPERWNYADLVKAAEQTVRRYEELELSLDLAAAEA